MAFTPGSRFGTLHNYCPRLVAFEYCSDVDRHYAKDTPSNFILFVGGLGDSLMTVRYPSLLSEYLPSTWSLVEVCTASTGAGWATRRLDEDSEDLCKAVRYFRNLAEKRSPGSSPKVVLLGHSTGSQIAMNYLVGPWKHALIPPAVLDRPVVDGAIFQAGISDREGLAEELSASDLETSLEVSRTWIKEGRGRDQLPESLTKISLGVSPSAERWLSLVDKEGDDDYFSSDLSDDRLERVWGGRGLASRGITIMALLGEKDEHMPKWLDKAQLLGRWETQVRGANGIWHDRSGVVNDATHNLNKNGDDIIEELCERILGLVYSVDPELAHRNVGKL